MKSGQPTWRRSESSGKDGDVSDDFYEDDEPIEDVLAAFASGEHGWTSEPSAPASTVYEYFFQASAVACIRLGSSDEAATEHAEPLVIA